MFMQRSGNGMRARRLWQRWLRQRGFLLIALGGVLGAFLVYELALGNISWWRAVLRAVVALGAVYLGVRMLRGRPV
jgi:hypothetical protein